MKQTLWQITIRAPSQFEDAVAEALDQVADQTPSIYTPDNSAESQITVFLQKPIPKASLQQKIRGELFRLNVPGLDLAESAVTIKKTPREDWSESWKKHFKVLEFGRSLLIRPSWSRRKAKPGQAVVVLDPGLSFGTGQHPTTKFCLQALVQERRRLDSPSFLDIGCGSGILGIAAAKLRYSPVDAFDNDPVAVAVATKNARRNRVDGRVRVGQRDLIQWNPKRFKRYDVVCANLIDDLLISQFDKIKHSVRPGGTLVLAGILSTQFDRVQSAYIENGFTPLKNITEAEWRSGSFRRNSG